MSGLNYEKIANRMAEVLADGKTGCAVCLYIKVGHTHLCGSAQGRCAAGIMEYFIKDTNQTRKSKHKTPMKVYYVYEKDSEYGIMVIARNVRMAKTFSNGKVPEFCESYVDLRANWVREITPPKSLPEGTIFESCDHIEWLCPAWRYDEGCTRCKYGEAKRAKFEEDEI